MKIIGIEGMTVDELNDELERGGRFIMYEYCISVLVMTIKQSSNIYFVKGNQNPVSKGLGFSLLSMVMGWWGIPWGPIYTIWALHTNFTGGKNVTREVIDALS